MATRKLKLQVQMTVDGFVAGPAGQLDWMTRNLDEGVIARIVQITDSIDTILLGRKMTDGFIKYWEAVQPENPEYGFARRMVDTPKVVFGKTEEHTSELQSRLHLVCRLLLAKQNTQNKQTSHNKIETATLTPHVTIAHL